ncbi:MULTISPECIES: hypothetical protein [Bacillus cereus group]|uniref:hypothetical protein n=1 Tax=Bacillus cereus group TaxID=86661 RepID=UPI000A3023D7|nr:hypothetical protein [Bacillus cereus]PEZ75177.1 hypothetical protein CN410_13750 [Bacillus anthracis]PGW06624.1 hypothetical protein COD97_26735 [Bacillus cereus]SME50600.1 hypothetical protein BACERE00183_04523 [Bacillus cereus]HDR7922209.1 hypothetical protein [Bacillus paranthracis]
MDLYIVKGKSFVGEYIESVQLLEGMEEKPKSYIGLGKQINKTKINKLEEGLSYGSYRIILTDKEKIDEARRRIKDCVYKYNLKELNRRQEAIKAIDNHDFTKAIKITNY